MNIRGWHWRRLMVALASVVLLAAMVYAGLVLHVFRQFSGSASLPADCALVFGAAVHRQTRSGPGIERRVGTAAAYYNQGELQHLVVSGGKGDPTHDSEAEVMRKTALRFGVQPEDIVLEDQATSTWENLLFSKPILQELECESVVGISDRYHLARIEYLARQQGWEELRTLPALHQPNPVFEARAVLREALGLAYYFFNSFLPVDRVITPRSDAPVL